LAIIIVGLLFDKRSILQENSQPKRARREFHTLLEREGGTRVGRTKGQKTGERRKEQKEGIVAVTNFRSSLRVVKKIRIKGECKGERDGE
jgi:hypothetical protein